MAMCYFVGGVSMTGHVRKRGNKWNFVIDIGHDENGKRKQKWSSGFNTKKEAQAALTQKLHELQTGTYIDSSSITVAEYLQYWLEAYAKTNTSPRTYEGYEMIVNKHLIPSLGRYQLQKLQPSQIQSYYTNALKDGRRDGKKGGLSHRTVLHHHRVLREALQQAIKWQLVLRNVADAVEPPKPDRPEMNTLAAEQVLHLLDVAKQHTKKYYPVIYMAVNTGMRRGEILGLRWQDIDFNNNTANIQQTAQRVIGHGVIFREPKTQKSRRSVSLPPSIMELLREIKVNQSKNKLVLGQAYQNYDLVFEQGDGKPLEPTEAGRAFRNVLKKAGYSSIRFHDLRHTHATLLLKEGVHPKIVSERLGHATIAITLDTYSHVLPHLQEEAANKLDEKLFGKVQTKVQTKLQTEGS